MEKEEGRGRVGKCRGEGEGKKRKVVKGWWINYIQAEIRGGLGAEVDKQEVWNSFLQNWGKVIAFQLLAVLITMAAIWKGAKAIEKVIVRQSGSSSIPTEEATPKQNLPKENADCKNEEKNLTEPISSLEAAICQLSKHHGGSLPHTESSRHGAAPEALSGAQHTHA